MRVGRVRLGYSAGRVGRAVGIGGGGFVGEDAGPGFEGLVGGDEEGAVFVAGGDEFEEDTGLGLILGDVGEVVEDEEEYIQSRGGFSDGSQETREPVLDDPPRGTPVRVSGGTSHKIRGGGTPVITPPNDKSA